MRKIYLFVFFSAAFLSGVGQSHWHVQARTLRYAPDGQEFVILNGNIKYNKALYGGNSAFRVETGDVPEFAMYMPGVGGNIHFGIILGNQSLWLNDCSFIESRYLPCKRKYIVKDDFMRQGTLELTAWAGYESECMLLEIVWTNAPQGMQLAWV